jgi:hypothetical protein
MFSLTGLNLAVGRVTIRSVMRIRFFLFLTGLVFALNSTQAALMRPLGIDELTRKADLIVRGTVLDKTSLRDVAGRIYTRVNVRVSEVWKGALPTNAAPNSLAIVQSGGTVGDVREEVSGEVQYNVGEEFVAFLVFNQRGEPVTIGLAQGKFHVWRDPQTGEKFAHNPFHGAPEPAGNGSQDKLRVSELKQQVRQVMP